MSEHHYRESDDFMCEMQFSAKVKDDGNHLKHKAKIPALDLSIVSHKHSTSIEYKNPDPVLDITQGIKEIEKSMMKDGEKPAFLMEKAKTKIDKREASQPTKVGSKVEE